MRAAPPEAAHAVVQACSVTRCGAGVEDHLHQQRDVGVRPPRAYPFHPAHANEMSGPSDGFAS
jgi:hypothetical protein